jgi:hypothetical protein
MHAYIAHRRYVHNCSQLYSYKVLYYQYAPTIPVTFRPLYIPFIEMVIAVLDAG